MTIVAVKLPWGPVCSCEGVKKEAETWIWLRQKSDMLGIMADGWPLETQTADLTVWVVTCFTYSTFIMTTWRCALWEILIMEAELILAHRFMLKTFSNVLLCQTQRYFLSDTMQIFLLLIVHSASVGWCLSFICIKWSHTVQKSRSLPLLFLSSTKFFNQFIPKSHCWSAFRCTRYSNVSFRASLFAVEKLLFYLCFPPSPS